MSAPETLAELDVEEMPPVTTLTIEKIVEPVPQQPRHQTFVVTDGDVYGLHLEPPDPTVLGVVLSNAYGLVKQYGEGTFQLQPEPVE
ncbi:hypothetical protein [Cellulosimicrobium sp. TH-20]|nr:hypothetical protein [Cellulosimicrobium sp. TH-20]